MLQWEKTERNDDGFGEGKGVQELARRCIVCDKGTTTGNKVSRSNRRSRRRWSANLQRVKLDLDGHVTSRYVCTRCLKGGKVKRAL